MRKKNPARTKNRSVYGFGTPATLMEYGSLLCGPDARKEDPERTLISTRKNVRIEIKKTVVKHAQRILTFAAFKPKTVFGIRVVVLENRGGDKWVTL